MGSDDVSRIVKHTIQMLEDTSQKRRRPLLAVRNLYTLLDEERFPNVEKLNDRLSPYWAALWRVCARGHYAAQRKPLRVKPGDNTEDFEVGVQRGLPSQEEAGYRLDLVRERGNEFSPCLQFPGPLAPRHPVYGYARIAEFRRMLEGLDLSRPLTQWKGHYFSAFAGIVENEDLNVSFCARENGVQLLLMNTLGPLLRGERLTAEQLDGVLRQVQSIKARKAQEILGKRLSQSEAK